MPKVYFLDTGLRNFLAKNFNSYIERTDSGQLLENACYRQLLGKNSFEEINFWRTSSGREVDFIVREKQTFEVKVKPDGFKPSKYKTFVKKYPEISLFLATLFKNKEKIFNKKILDVWEI